MGYLLLDGKNLCARVHFFSRGYESGNDEIFADRVKSEPRCDGATIVFSGNLLKFSHNLHYSS